MGRVRGRRGPLGALLASSWRPRCSGCGGGSGPSSSHHALQRPARADHRALVGAFEKKTGITVNVRFDDEDVLADQIVTEGSHSPADVFFTENSPPLRVPGLQGPAEPGRPVDPGKHAVPVQFAGRALGRRLGPGQRDGLQHLAAQGRASSRPRPCSWPILSGRASSPSPAARPTSSPSSRPSPAPTVTRRPSAGWRRQGERRQPQLPGQRDRDRRGQPGPGGHGHRQPVLLVPGAGRGRRVNMHSAIALLRPARRGLCPRRLRGRDPQVLPAPGRRPEFLAFLDLDAGSGDHRPQRQLRVPDRLGRDHGQPETPFDQLQPNGITIAELGTGAEAIKLLQEAQLL